MVETKFYCDNCKKEVSSKDELVPLWVSMKIADRQTNHGGDICCDCLSELGFEDCKDNNKYVKNYSNLVNNVFSIAKKILRK